MVAAFLGVLELIKVRKLIVADSADGEWNKENALLDSSTRFVINENADDVEESEYLADGAETLFTQTT